VFFYYFIKWSIVVVVEQWHHTEVASSISTFLSSAVTDLLATGKFNFLTTATAFSFVLWSTPLLCCIIPALRFAIFFLHSLQMGYTALAESCFASYAMVGFNFFKNRFSHSSTHEQQVLPLQSTESNDAGWADISAKVDLCVVNSRAYARGLGA